MIRAIGTFVVTVPGTLKRVESTSVDLRNDGAIHGILIQARPANVGRVYIGGSDLDRAALTGLFGILAIPTDNSLPVFTAALTLAPNAIKLTDFYIDADQANDGVIVSVLIA